LIIFIANIKNIKSVTYYLSSLMGIENLHSLNDEIFLSYCVSSLMGIENSHPLNDKKFLRIFKEGPD